MTARRAQNLSGRIKVPGDKSISHRALIFGALALGETTISGLLESEDVINTAKALRALGAPVSQVGDQWVVKGCGIGGLGSPDQPLDFGNSGTGVRLMMGVIAGNAARAQLTGDASLSSRPMSRVLDPLRDMGLETAPIDGKTLPLTVVGTHDLMPIRYTLPMPSAQVKSAILLAGLHAAGATTVVEPIPTRDHTERMLAHFGAAPTIETDPATGVRLITVTGQIDLTGRAVNVPSDPSSAAFAVVAAIITEGSDLTIERVLVNETRVGLYKTLQEMGADLTFANERTEAGEPTADIRVRAGRLKGITVPASRAPSMIDEYPVLAVAAAFGDGTTRMEGLHELTVKESDRLAATAAMLKANGVRAAVSGDTLEVTGQARVPGGGTVTTHLDHRIAMSALVLGQATEAPVTVDDASPISTSFPTFQTLMEGIGARIGENDGGAA